MVEYLGNVAEDATVTFAWDSNDGNGASVTRTADGTVYVEKVGALKSSSITAATVTKDNPGVVTDTAHGLEDGDEVFFYNMSEMTELNQGIRTVANKADNTFEIATTAGYGSAESTGGAWVQVNTAEVTDTEDWKGVVGSHETVIDTSGDDYFVTGADYKVYLNAATIDGQVVNATLAQFSIEHRFTNVQQISGDAVAANNLEAILDGSGITGNVDLTMRSLTVTNDAGVGVAVTGTTIGLDVNATGGVGIDVDGSTSGLTIDGANGIGLHAQGTTHGFEITASAGPGAEIQGTTYGMQLTATGGTGLYAYGADANGHGIHAKGDATSAGTGAGIYAEAGAVAAGIYAKGGATSGAGIYGAATAGNDAGMQLVKHGTGADLDADIVAATVTSIVTAILAGTADGVAVSTILERLNAYAKGEIARTDSTYVYKKEGGTTSFTNVGASGGRNL